MHDEKLSRRDREKLRCRSEMLAVAMELFSEKGYHSVSMHEIAARAEFSIGTLYKFFKNKEDLYKALMMEKAAEYHRILMDVLSKETDVLTIIKDYIANKVSIFTNNTAILRLYFAEIQGASFNFKAGLDQDMHRLHNEIVERLASVLEKGVREKVFREVNPYYLAVALDGLTRSFLFCWLDDPVKHPYEAQVPLITELFLKGCLANE